MSEPRDLSLADAARLIRAGQLQSEELLRSCLARIEEREEQVQAWATLHAEEALNVARQRDEEAQRGDWQGMLHGLPIGVKDIFDVIDMETRAGTDAYTPHRALQDASAVARLRAQGAVILGKTHTTAFAMGDPAPTRNPWNLEHTPGGSSAGSAAAVADHHCLAALGTQTAGSVIRPAAYNGVVGFKPSYGAVSTEGVLPLSWQLDHVGTFTRTVEDAWWLWQVLRGDKNPTQTTLPEVRLPARMWRIRTLFEERADTDLRNFMDVCCGALQRQGIVFVERSMPADFERCLEMHHTIMATEAASVHRMNFQRNEAAYPPQIAELVREGLEIKAHVYLEALRQRQALTPAIEEVLASVDLAIAPAISSPAPKGLEHTGDRSLQTPWSLLGSPVITIPVGLCHGLPVGVQLVSLRGEEERIFGLVAACAEVIAFSRSPATRESPSQAATSHSPVSQPAPARPTEERPAAQKPLSRAEELRRAAKRSA